MSKFGQIKGPLLVQPIKRGLDCVSEWVLVRSFFLVEVDLLVQMFYAFPPSLESRVSPPLVRWQVPAPPSLCGYWKEHIIYCT